MIRRYHEEERERERERERRNEKGTKSDRYLTVQLYVVVVNIRFNI